MLVLKKSIAGKHFVFNRNIYRKHPKQDMAKVEYDSSNIIYYGQVATNKGRVFKLLGEDLFYGPQQHRAVFIRVYTASNQYIGKFKMDEPADYLTKGMLVFKYVNTTGFPCKVKLIDRVDFNHGLPDTFDLGCPIGGIQNFGLVKYW